MATSRKAAPVAAPTPSKQDDTVVLNIAPLLTPISILISAILISVSIFLGASTISKSGIKTTSGGPTPTTTAAGDGTTTISIDTIKDIFSKDYVKFGDTSKKVLFVEVADPSCPYCHIAGGENHELNKSQGYTLKEDGGTYIAPVSEMRKLVDEGKAGYAYIYMPGHGNGEMGMKAMYCGHEQGKFWAVHDLLMTEAGYELQNTTVKNDKSKSQIVADFLKSAIDPSFMKSCLDSGKYDARLTTDTAQSQALGVKGTPGFFINDKLFPGAYSWTDMESTVNAAL
jgi:protein-disulfide isomerase